MTRGLLPLTLALLPAAALAQIAAPLTLPPGTQLPVSIPKHLPMQVGEPIRAELLYPVYAGNHLVLPAHTLIGGSVVALNPDRTRRVTARLRADFTPFYKPVVRFDSIVPPNAAPVPITTGEAADGAPVYKLVPRPAPRGGIVGQYLEILRGYIRDTIASITGPEKGDRLLQFLYSQLPYHPQRIAQGTAWTVETTSPVTLAPIPEPPPPPAPDPAESKSRVAKLLAPPPPIPQPAAGSDEAPTWTLQAYLDDGISSETSKTDQVIHATVAEPVLNPDGSIAVPQGAVLTGAINQARPARHFTRAGVLRFTFTEIKLPGQESQTVRATLASADSSSAAQLAMNSEGQVKPQAQDRIIIPALLIFLASQPLDQDHHGGEDHLAGKDAAASSGLGLITLIVGTAAQQPNFALGVGYYSAAVALYPRFFGKGPRIAFPKDTRIVIQTTTTRSAALKPNSATAAP